MFTFLITWTMLKFQIKALSSPAFARPSYGNNFSVLPPPGERLTSVIFMILSGLFQMLQHLLCTNLLSVFMSFCSLIEVPTPRWFYHLLFPNQTSTMDPSIDPISKKGTPNCLPHAAPFQLEEARLVITPFPYSSEGVPSIRGVNEIRIGDRQLV